MSIRALGYIGVHSAWLDDWDGLAVRLLGMQRIDASAGLRAYRMDDRRQRLVISDQDDETLGFLGWEVADAAALDALAGRLEDHDITVMKGSRRLADERYVRDLVVFHDPAGNRLEAFYGAAVASDPFVPGRPISGFLTGPLGLGHAVLHVPDVELLLPFYRDLLGFRVTDFGLAPYKVYFFHVNARHHSFAMVGSGRHGFHHFMVELKGLDDVGQAYDLAELEPGRLAYTLGRHSNDYVTSFYAHTPSGFLVEYGWGGRQVDSARWEAHETFDGPSFWGHERLSFPPDQRKRLREMRLAAAARGVRANVNPGDPSDAVIASE
jgi:2,3-dihydroxybiphenyl 1,2-dioxygenase